MNVLLKRKINEFGEMLHNSEPVVEYLKYVTNCYEKHNRRN